ncbi:mitotic spindle assembly checkpoint protein-like protein MAD1 [Venturia nashicola]|nr:mitotic spindle assembly checkpoint protein-like protein MAD1 [Venturia nashicola]
MATARNQPTFDFFTGEEVPKVSKAPELSKSRMRPSHSEYREHQPLPQSLPTEELHARIRTLEYEVATLKQEKEVTSIQHDQEIRELETRAESDHKRSVKFEGENTATKNRYNLLLKESQDKQAQLTNEKLDLERRLRNVTGQKSSLEEERDEAQEQLSNLERESERNMNELESRHQTLQTSFDQLRAEFETQSSSLQNAHRKLVQREAEIQELESEVSKLKSRGGDAETEIIKRQLSEQVTQNKRLDRTNKAQLAELTEFRKLQKSVEIVEEEKRALESKVRMMDSLQTELAQEQLRAQVLEEEKSAWMAFLENQGESSEIQFDSPEDMARAFVQQQIENASLVERLGAVQPELMSKDETIRELEELRLKLQAELQEAKTSIVANSDTKAKSRLERMKTLAVKETEYLRAQLKAMDDEEKEFHPERYAEETAKKIQGLQDVVDEYRREVDTMHADLTMLEKEKETEPPSTPLPSRKRGLEDPVDERHGELLRKNRKLQNDFTQLRTKYDVLKNEVRVQSKQIESLKTSSSRARILELRDNPTATANAIKQSTLTALQAENETLQAQLAGQLPSSGLSESEHLVPRASLETLKLQLQSRDSTLATKEKFQTRLRAIFSAKAHEFREAVFSLLGWKLEFQPNGRVKATSMFHPGTVNEEAGEEGNFIVFDGENATMKVSGGTESVFAREIRGLIDFWVDGRGQIPCFLAAMTLEFYDRYGIVEEDVRKRAGRV